MYYDYSIILLRKEKQPAPSCFKWTDPWGRAEPLYGMTSHISLVNSIRIWKGIQKIIFFLNNFDLIHGTMVISQRPVQATQQDLNLKSNIQFKHNIKFELIYFSLKKQSKKGLGM